MVEYIIRGWNKGNDGWKEMMVGDGDGGWKGLMVEYICIYEGEVVF